MLYNVVGNGDDISYIPTPLGKGLLVVLFLALLTAAVVFAGRKADHLKKHSIRLTAKQLVFCAVAIALGTVLSNLKLYHFPFGGSITLFSMLFICIPGYWFGLKAGLVTGVAYGILQLRENISRDPAFIFVKEKKPDIFLSKIGYFVYNIFRYGFLQRKEFNRL